MGESPDTSSTSYKAEIIAQHLRKRCEALKVGRASRPLMVSMQGPQGAGKSTLAAALVGLLAEWGLKTAVASLDDFYLTFAGLKKLARDCPSNALLQGRGPPGTHDVPLLSQTLTAVRQINESSTLTVQLPSFDKSQNAGFGDRSLTPVPLAGPLDIFILEGWSLGFAPLPLDAVKRLHASGRTASTHPLSTMEEINTNLQAFASEINGRFDTHISISPRSYDYVYKWRLQQEHAMKASNGGRGMSDDEVEKFVDRYMPVYEVYKGTDGECGGLRLVFGENREVLRVEEL